MGSIYKIRLLKKPVFLNHSGNGRTIEGDEIFLPGEIADKSWSHNEEIGSRIPIQA